MNGQCDSLMYTEQSPLHMTRICAPSSSYMDIVAPLIQVASELYSRGYEANATALYETCAALLRGPSEEVYVLAQKHLRVGNDVLLAEETEADEDHHMFPADLYEEDECDVGPRVLRTPVVPDTSLFFNEPTYLEAILCFNRALVYQDNLNFTEAKNLFSLVLQAIQSLLLTINCARPCLQVLEMGSRAHNNMGHICYLAGDEDIARAHFEASLMFARQLSDFTKVYRLEYATVLSNWCRVNWMRGDISDQLYNGLREVLRIRSSLLRWDNIDVAAAHYNLAVAEYSRQRNQKAISHLMQFLAVANKRAEEDLEDLDSIPALIYLLLIQNEDKDDSVSQELVRGLRTLQDKRQDQGSDSPEVASVLNFIGTLLFHKEDFENALLFFQEELRLEETFVQANDDISVSVTCNNIGRILQELGKLPEAMGFYQRALEFEYGDVKQLRAKKGSVYCPFKKSNASNFRPTSANLYSTVWYNLGLIHDKLGSYADAIVAFEMSLALRRSMLGNDHPDIACLLYNIGVLQMEQQLLNEATLSFREALRIRRGGEAGQLNDKHVVKTLEKLASLHKAKGNIRGALEAVEEVLTIQEGSCEYDYVSRMRETGSTLRSLSELHHATGNLQRALNIATQSVQNLRSAYTAQLSDNMVTTIEKTAVLEQLVSSLLLVGSLFHELSEPLLASEILGQAAESLREARTAYSMTTLEALQEVTCMLATTHCAAGA